MSYFKASTLGVLARFVTAACRLVTLPLVLGLLDKERYGLWLVIGSFLSWLSLSDLGVPSALQNPLIEALAQGNKNKALGLIRYALLFLSKISFALGVGVIFLILILPLGEWMGVALADRGEFLLVLISSVVLLCVALPLRITNVIAYAIGRPQDPPLFEIFVQIVSLLLLGLCVWWRFASLFALLVSVNLVQVAFSFFLYKALMRRSGLWVFSADRAIATTAERKQLHGTGVLFLLVLIGEGLVLQSDAFIIGFKLTPADVANYLVPNMLFVQFLLLQNAFLRPLWPIFTQMHSAGDREGLARILNKGLLLSLVAGIVFGLGVGLCGGWFIHFWTNGVVSMPPLMAWGFAAYSCVASLTNILAIFCNAVGLVSRRLCAVLSFGFLKIVGGLVCLQFLSINFLPITYFFICLCSEFLILFYLSRMHVRVKSHGCFGVQG